MASVDTVNASSSSSSSSSLPFNNVFSEDRKKYDVFLSFRGSDTRKNFTDHLFVAMVQKGIFTFRDDEALERGRFIASELLMAIEESKFAVVVLSRDYASSTWCLAEVAKIVECMEKKKLIVLPIFHYVDPSDVRHQRGAFADAFAKLEERFKDSTEVVSLWRDALTKVANIPGWVLNDGDPESQLIDEFIESLSNKMPEDGSTNWNSPPRSDVTPDESDDAVDDADEMVQDYVADLPLIGLENESLYNLSNSEVQLIREFIESLSNWMPEDGSTNWNLPPRFDVTPDESDDADDDADEMVQDNVADLPLEAHVVPDDVADAPQEAHVVPDDVANVPQEAHEVGDHAANSQRLCPICDNAIGVAFCCGHQFCVECGYRCSTCPICRDRVHIRLRLY